MSSESKVFNLCLCVVILQGINLSGGQRQRICVARALYQNTNIVFLVGTNFFNTDNFPTVFYLHPLQVICHTSEMLWMTTAFNSISKVLPEEISKLTHDSTGYVVAAIAENTVMCRAVIGLLYITTHPSGQDHELISFQLPFLGMTLCLTS